MEFHVMCELKFKRNSTHIFCEFNEFLTLKILDQFLIAVSAHEILTKDFYFCRLCVLLLPKIKSKTKLTLFETGGKAAKVTQ